MTEQMKNNKKTYSVVGIWLIGVSLLLLVLFQIRSYATVINDAGLVRGGTQRIVKLETNHSPDDALIAYVGDLLDELQLNEQKKLVPSQLTQEFLSDLKAVETIWVKLQAEILLVRGGAAPDNLLALSEDHFQLSNKAVYCAQRRAEVDFRYIIIISFLLLVFTTALIVFLEWRSRRKIDRVFFTDFLTGLPNSLFFEERVTALTAGASAGTYIMVYLNVNNFKFINESYGYPAGDRLLINLAGALDRFCGKGEACARINADRFALLLHSGAAVLERLKLTVDRALRTENELNLSEAITCSYGVYEIADADESAKSIISKATRALTEGDYKDGVAFYDKYLLDKITRETHLTQAMRQAIERDEFQVYLQPKVRLSTGLLVGAEVLCRWISAEFGFLPPDDFIPLFEKNGFIVTLDFHMLEKTCAEFRRILHEETSNVVSFSINFSRVTLLQDNFLERFCEVVERYEIPHVYIEVEVTESAFIMNEEIVIQMLLRLKQNGYRIVMDDFGLGYSSLNLLRKLPIDVLKIDKEFLREGTTIQRTYSIIQCIVEMAAGLGIEIVCEGVESEEHVKLLSEMGCPIGQGYFFSRPISIEDFQQKYRAEATRDTPSDITT